jgi:hypothetical protein
MDNNLFLGLAVVVMVGVIPCALGFADYHFKRGMKIGRELGQRDALAEIFRGLRDELGEAKEADRG